MKKIHATANPNIAFIKYWGKKPSSSDETLNLALNPSVSLTLSQAKSDVFVSLAKGTEHEIFVQGNLANSKDAAKIFAHLQRVSKAFDKPLPPLRIESSNNFPSATGIASSASAFAALSYGISAFFLQKTTFSKSERTLLSQLSRRGSGSACRSVAGPFMKWDGDSAEAIESSWKLFDTIVIISKKEKLVSSSQGHSQVLSSPLWPKRQERVLGRYEKCLGAIAQASLTKLGPIIEEEATEMHEVAESSVPPIHYRMPETFQFLKALQSLKNRDFFFTIDAGPNVHLISERPIKSEIEKLLADEGLEAEIWQDWTGFGPVVKEFS